MLRKRSTADDTPLHPARNGATPVLDAADSLQLSHYPAEVIDAHRYLITRLMRDQAIDGQIALVAALRGEGVTYSSLAMATTLSNDFSKRVCYVDLNWWWPAPALAGLLQQSAGMAAILQENATPDEVLVKTGSANLCLLPAGRLSPALRPVMAHSEGLKAALARLREQFDVLLLDIPAILATSDAMALAALGDSCLVVIKQGGSTRTSVRQALDEIAHLPVTGVLLNRVRVATPKWVRHWLPEN
jgi:Mrp family chromosome partitioning ATPase